MSFYVDWRLPLKYGERAIEIGFRITGLEMAHRWSRFLGKKLALVACMRKLLTMLNVIVRTKTPWRAPETLTTA